MDNIGLFDTSFRGFANGTNPDVPNAYFSITLGELLYKDEYTEPVFSWTGVMDWSEFAFSPEQYERVCAMFEAKYYWEEISEPGNYQKWLRLLAYTIKYELCPKYNKLYELEANKELQLLPITSQFGKSREIESEFPETLLSGNSDYASFGKDREYEDIKHGDVLERLLLIQEKYRSIDQLFVEELQPFFAMIYSTNLNVF